MNDNDQGLADVDAQVAYLKAWAADLFFRGEAEAVLRRQGRGRRPRGALSHMNPTTTTDGAAPASARRRFVADDDNRFVLAMTAVVAAVVLIAVLAAMAVGVRISGRSAAKDERVAVACVQAGGAWIAQESSCVYSQRAAPATLP